MRSSASLVVILPLLAIWVGCSADFYFYTCTNYDKGHKDAQGAPDPCHLNDSDASADAGPGCPGECVPKQPPGWSEPALFWIGPASELPSRCPDQSPTFGRIAWADLIAPHTCAPCACQQSTGSCALPTTITARAAICPGTGGWVTPFDAPAGWNGSCTDINAVPLGKDCGGSPCVQSLIISPLTVMEGGCQPVEASPPPTLTPAVWKTAALACVGQTSPLGCEDKGEICVPTSEPPPPGFKQCVYSKTETSCPASYPEEHVVYDDYEEHRGCAACQCGAPTGSTCTAFLSVYEGAGCTSPLFENHKITSDFAPCVDLGPGSGLLSKSSSEPSYQPGACPASGGEPMGEAVPVGRALVCCRPKP